MRILIDIGHPAHVHLFRNFAHIMQNNGHKILFSCRDKEFEIALLRANGFDFVSFGKKYKSIAGKIYGLCKFDLKEWQTCCKFKPDILLSHGSPYAAHAAWLIKRPHISFEDTYNFEQIKLYEPFTDVILTASYEHPVISQKEIRYDGYHEIAYLSPKYFIPDETIFKQFGLSVDEKLSILRFVSWNASHDRGHIGISMEYKIKAVKQISQYSRVLISSEGELPKELEKYRIKLSPDKIYDIMAYASLVYGESSTMAEEAAMLGVPSIYYNNKSTYYTRHLEKQYGLIYNFRESEEDQEAGIQKAIELLTTPSLANVYKQKSNLMLREKIDVTAFMVWFVENYPQSKQIMQENPNYQDRFR